MSEITSPRARVVVIGVDGQEPFLTLTMTFGPDYPGQRLDGIAADIAATAQRAIGATADDDAGPALTLNENERNFLSWALDQAANEMQLGGGGDSEDRAALASLRRLAEGGVA